MSKALKCSKCGRRFRERAFDAERWNVGLHAGIIEHNQRKEHHGQEQ